MVVPLRGDDCRHAARASDRTRGSHPALPQKKTDPHGARVFLAGGEGFEPPLAESESAVQPLDEPPSEEICCLEDVLALGVLRSATCFSQANLLALYLAGIAGHEAGFS